MLSQQSLIVGTMARQGDDPETRLAIYDAALARGLNTFDTAPLYGFGVAEQILGRMLATVPRGDVRVLGKVGLRWGPDARGELLFRGERADGEAVEVRRDSRPEAVIDDVERSLERLGTDYLDLVQIHQPDPQTPIGETMDALSQLRAAGRVREIGVSNFDAGQIVAAQRALGPIPLFSLQTDYSLLQRRIEPELLGLCRNDGIAVLAYSPLAAGRLARRPDGAGDATLARAVNEVLLPMARRYGVAPAAVALRWLLEQPGVSGAISGLSSVAQLEDQAAALAMQLSAEDVASLRRGFNRAAARESARTGHGLRRRIGNLLRRLGVAPADVKRAVRRAGGARDYD